MSGWVPMRHDLRDHPKIVTLSLRLGVTQCARYRRILHSVVACGPSPHGR